MSMITAPVTAPALPALDPAVGDEVGDDILLDVARAAGVTTVANAGDGRGARHSARAWTASGGSASVD